MKRQTKSRGISGKGMVLIGNRLGSYIANGVTYFSCPICNMLFKREKLGMKHMQNCKPLIVPNIKQSEVTNARDPLEITPEEAQIINNNCIKQEQVEVIDEESNLDSKNIKNDMPVAGRRRRKRCLSGNEIQERLRKISERLGKSKKTEVPIEDEGEEQEEDQRKEIEEKLSLLNQESEQCLYQAEADTEDFKGVFLKSEEESEMDMEERIIIVTQQPDGQLHGCRKCPEVFVTPMDLLRHSRLKHSYPKIMMAPSEVEKYLERQDMSHCPVCQKPLVPVYKSVYVRHLQTHSWMAEHVCKVCKKKFKRRDHMKAHERRHIV